MKYETTKDILNVLSPYFEPDDISVSTASKDWKGRSYQSDFVTLIKEQNVFFEVFDNEIVVQYFTAHIHFEDYAFDLADGDPDYIARAKEFLIQLFTLPLRHRETQKGHVPVSERYFFVLPDYSENCISGLICHRLIFGFNPFAKKIVATTTWQYDVQKKCFSTNQPWKADPNAIEVICEDEDCYIEIFENKGAYSYLISRLELDDYNGCYYWAPLDDGTKSLFDTKEKAICDAKNKATPHCKKDPE